MKSTCCNNGGTASGQRHARCGASKIFSSKVFLSFFFKVPVKMANYIQSSKSKPLLSLNGFLYYQHSKNKKERQTILAMHRKGSLMPGAQRTSSTPKRYSRMAPIRTPILRYNRKKEQEKRSRESNGEQKKTRTSLPAKL